MAMSDETRRRNLVREDSDSDFVCSCCYELMVEPTTLVCGHNFCRLCLANWALTSKKKECPTCRQEWQGHPRVNITLRNMMHKMLGERILIREQEISTDPDNRRKIEEFDVRMSAASPHKPKTDVGAFCTGICLALGAILFAYLVWYWRSSENDLLIHKPAVRWKVSDVATWFTHMGWAEQYVDVVIERGIDGPMMLSIDYDNIVETLNVTDPLHQRALLTAIDDIRDKGVKMPGTLWEYKALYPGRCLFLIYGLKEFPRGTLLYIWFFNYEDVFLPFLHLTSPANDADIPFNWAQIPPPTIQQWITFLVNAVLLPYWLIAKFTWSMFSAQYWTSLFILLNCMLQSILEASLLKKYFMQSQWRLTIPSLKSYAKMLLVSFITSIVWPIIPRFVCDFFFYCNLYYTPLQQAKSMYVSWRHNLL